MEREAKKTAEEEQKQAKEKSCQETRVKAENKKFKYNEAKSSITEPLITKWLRNNTPNNIFNLTRGKFQVGNQENKKQEPAAEKQQVELGVKHEEQDTKYKTVNNQLPLTDSSITNLLWDNSRWLTYMGAGLLLLFVLFLYMNSGPTGNAIIDKALKVRNVPPIKWIPDFLRCPFLIFNGTHVVES